jgi:hypothetical protein
MYYIVAKARSAARARSGTWAADAPPSPHNVSAHSQQVMCSRLTWFRLKCLACVSPLAHMQRAACQVRFQPSVCTHALPLPSEQNSDGGQVFQPPPPPPP